MKIQILAAIACAGLLAACNAETKTAPNYVVNKVEPVKVVPGDQTTAIASADVLKYRKARKARTRSSCDYWAPPRARILVSPEYGKANFEMQKRPYRIKDRSCKNVDPMTTLGFYTPNAGFRGQDRMVVRYEYDFHNRGDREDIVVEYQFNVQ